MDERDARAVVGRERGSEPHLAGEPRVVASLERPLGASRDIHRRSVRHRSSAKLGEALRDDGSVREPRLHALAYESANGGGQSGPEFLGINRADVGIRESSEGFSGKVVVGPCLRRGHAFAQARERQRMIAHRADVVLRLPDTRSLGQLDRESERRRREKERASASFPTPTIRKE